MVRPQGVHLTLNTYLMADDRSAQLPPEAARVPLCRAIEWLRSQSVLPHSVTEWARALGYSREHFSREIRRSYGQSPVRLLRDERLDHIERLLRPDAVPNCYAIARAAGLTDEKALNAFVTRHVGVSPRNWWRILIEEQGRTAAVRNDEGTNSDSLAARISRKREEHHGSGSEGATTGALHVVA